MTSIIYALHCNPRKNNKKRKKERKKPKLPSQKSWSKSLLQKPPHFPSHHHQPLHTDRAILSFKSKILPLQWPISELHVSSASLASSLRCSRCHPMHLNTRSEAHKAGLFLPIPVLPPTTTGPKNPGFRSGIPCVSLIQTDDLLIYHSSRLLSNSIIYYYDDTS